MTCGENIRFKCHVIFVTVMTVDWNLSVENYASLKQVPRHGD